MWMKIQQQRTIGWINGSKQNSCTGGSINPSILFTYSSAQSHRFRFSVVTCAYLLLRPNSVLQRTPNTQEDKCGEWNFIQESVLPPKKMYKSFHRWTIYSQSTSIDRNIDCCRRLSNWKCILKVARSSMATIIRSMFQIVWLQLKVQVRTFGHVKDNGGGQGTNSWI